MTAGQQDGGNLPVSFNLTMEKGRREEEYERGNKRELAMKRKREKGSESRLDRQTDGQADTHARTPRT